MVYSKAIIAATLWAAMITPLVTTSTLVPESTIGAVDDEGEPQVPEVERRIAPDDWMIVDDDPIPGMRVNDSPSTPLPPMPSRNAETDSSPAPAESCSEVTENERICVNLEELPTDPDQRSRMNEPEPEWDIPISFPQWCGSGEDPDRPLVTRTQYCDVDLMTVWLQRFANGAWTDSGRGLFGVINYTYTSPELNNWSSSLNVYTIWTDPLASGLRVFATPDCSDSCELGNHTFPQQTLLPTKSAEGIAFFSMDPEKGEALQSHVGWNLYFTSSTGMSSATATLRGNAEVRCDDMVSGKRSGCIITNSVPEVMYDAVIVDEFAAHIVAAQASNLPGSREAGRPLSRMQDGKQADWNRTSVCKRSFVRPPLKSCDEYPFASTYDGGASEFDPARTFDFCSIPEYPTGITDSMGASACMINARQNSAAGTFLRAKFYMPYRVIDGDPFYVGVE